MNTLGKLNWPIWSPTVRSPSYSTLDMNLRTAEAFTWERKKEQKRKNIFTQSLTWKSVFEIMVPLIYFGSDWPAFVYFAKLQRKKERQRDRGWFRVVWHWDIGKIKRRGRCWRAITYIHSFKMLECKQMQSFSLSPNLFVSFFLCGAFMTLSVREKCNAQNLCFKSSVCICKIPTDTAPLALDVSVSNVI